ncbi:helix-turn-helix domain-containing protein [Jeotgalibacillus sp. JSM ZJ347]|uniref:helix-turn-helix domain-containing protein n=1 Tax=Jeotgalibacillus sp. JSM ZJ347 TaxID=3342117 RepID=UPI0035A84D68
MNYLDAVILTGLDIINGERTQSSIYHLLKGKKTSQTIQDAQLYGISPLFKLYRNMKRPYYDQRITGLTKEGLIHELDNLKYGLTAQGKVQLSEFFQHHPFPLFLNGWKYHEMTYVFWNRLTLIVQTVSNLVYKEHQFIPVNREIPVQQWVKKVINQNRDSLQDYTQQLNRELVAIFDRQDFPDSPEIIVQQLSGYKMIGKTSRQLADQFKCGPDEIYTRFINEIHFMFSLIENDKGNFPVIAEMMNVNPESIPFTRSTAETYQYISKDFSIDRIASIRRLKRSTIEDHILEIALLDKSFSISSFVPDTMLKMIEDVSENSNRLKTIKDQIPEAEYFQIRLVLAKAERGERIWKNYLKKNLGIAHSVQDKKKLYRPS